MRQKKKSEIDNMLVVKDNALINASYNLDLVEQRLVLLAIVEARENIENIDSNTELTVHASSYIKHFNVEKHTAYKNLKDAAKTLFSRQFSYEESAENGHITHYTSRWVSKIGYTAASGSIKIIFAPDVVPLITRIEKHFTSYELFQVGHLSSKYSTRLYELLISWRSVGKTPIYEINDFKKKLGIEDHEYKIISNFKLRVLDPAIKQINESTDIKANYEQHKQGRTITGFSFSFKQKKQQIKNETQKEINTLDVFNKLTEKQLDMFSSKLADLPAVQAMAHIGEDMKPFVARLRTMLMDVEQQKVLLPYLKEVGDRKSVV